jgi:hypothetical protein
MVAYAVGVTFSREVHLETSCSQVRFPVLRRMVIDHVCSRIWLVTCNGLLLMPVRG